MYQFLRLYKGPQSTKVRYICKDEFLAASYNVRQEVEWSQMFSHSQSIPHELQGTNVSPSLSIAVEAVFMIFI